MTLALYGKSRQRQGGLLLLGLLAVLVAMLAGVATITSAFAHSTSYSSTRQCDESWSATGTYHGGTQERLIVLSDVVVNGDAFATTGWSTQSPLSFSTTVPAGVTFASNPSGTSLYYWKGTYNGTRTIFSRSAGAGTFLSGSPNWGGGIQLYRMATSGTNAGKWVTDGALDNVTAPNRPSSCDRTIRVRKVVEGSGAPAQTFSYTISPAGVSDTVSSSNSYDDHDVPKNVAQTVTETESLSGGWSFVKYARRSGLDNNCNGDEWSDQGTVQGDGVSIPDDTHDYTVCIYNQYTDPSVIILSSSACIIDNNVQYAQFHFLIPNSANVAEGAGGTLSGTYNDGAGQSFGPINEDAANNGHPDWTFTLPFGGGPSVQLLTALSSNGYTWPATGAGHEEKDTVSKAACQPVVLEPGIEKVAADPDYSGGYAHWLIKVNNAANSQTAEVKIEDSNVLNDGAVSGGSCLDGDISDGTMICTVSANSTLVVPVKRAVSQRCVAGEASNSATISWKAPGSNEFTQLGTVGPVAITIPANPDACDKPGIAKEASSQTTQDPSDVKWTVTVTNPASGTGTTQTVYIKDSLVNVVSGPTYGGSASCTTSDFEADLNGSGVQCSMPNNSTITFEVKPAGTIAQTCDAQKFNNTAYLYIGSTGGTPLSDAGEEITLQGDPSLCTRTIEVCKVVVDNGDGSTDGGRFAFQLSWNKAVQGGIFVGELLAGPHPMEGDASAICTTFQAPANETVTIIETNGRPGGNAQQPGSWNGDDPQYPQNDYDGLGAKDNRADLPSGTNKVTFYNKTLPRTRDLEICKVVVGNGDGYIDGGVFKFDVTGIDAIELVAYEPALDATDGAEGTAVCETVKVALGQVTVTEWMARPPTYGWEGSWNDDDPLYPQNDVYGLGVMKETANVPGDTDSVTFYNKTDPRTREITITKHFVDLPDGFEVTKDDYPTFVLDPVPAGFDFNTDCEIDESNLPYSVTWTCTVPYDWKGDVQEDESLPAGWQQTLCEERDTVQQIIGLVQSLTQFQEEGPQSYWDFCNRPFGTVVVVKYENVPPATAQSWNFDGTLPGAPIGLSTTGTTNVTDGDQATVSSVTPGSYTLAELEGRGVCESGDTSSDYQTRGLVQVGGSLPNASDLNAAPIIGANDLNVTVQKGTTTYVVFGNQGCGSVLSAANLQVIKYSDPAANFTGTTELGGWTISITGTAGAATGFNASEDTVAGTGAFFLGIPDGTYTVCETPKANWVVVGSKYNATNQAGVCRTGVVVNLDQTVVVNFYNQPRVNIEVNKTEISLATPAGAPGNGWSFTLTGCGITPQVKATGVDGKATFTDLPPAVGCSYTVTETVIGGWSAINPVQVTAPAAAGQTAVLNFTNVKIEVCTDCFTIVTPTPTPEKPTPTPTATPTDPSDPTATPTEKPKDEPTEKPTKPDKPKDEDTAGEKTPGPGQTPIAPSTGTGLMGSGPGGVNMLFALVGLLAISLGSTILALGRKSSRR
ncbi:MAG: hypothetical protein IH609_09030 [Dehalococcoidia bacterium]|nr:hypothetical protein [Dehalococcoidia bacterium]